MYVPHSFGCHRDEILGAAIMALIATGCFSPQRLPVRGQPPRELPPIAIEPAPQVPGTGRIVLDSIDGPARVEEVVAQSNGEAFAGHGFAFASATSTKPVCSTPCVVDLPYGNHELVFRSVGDRDSYVATVVAGAKPSIYRMAPTRTSGPTARGLAVTVQALAATALIVGPLLILAASSRSTSDSGREADYRSTGTKTTLLGGIALGVGIAIDFAGRGTIQPGSDVQWVPADGTLYKRIE